MNPKTLTLTGCLGKDRDGRWTKPKTTVLTLWNKAIDRDEEIEVTTPSRDYLRMTLAVRERGLNGWQTRWVNLIVWDLNLTAVADVRFSRTGDRVQVTGIEEAYPFPSEDGVEREFRYISVRSFRRLG